MGCGVLLTTTAVVLVCLMGFWPPLARAVPVPVEQDTATCTSLPWRDRMTTTSALPPVVMDPNYPSAAWGSVENVVLLAVDSRRVLMLYTIQQSISMPLAQLFTLNASSHDSPVVRRPAPPVSLATSDTSFWAATQITGAVLDYDNEIELNGTAFRRVVFAYGAKFNRTLALGVLLVGDGDNATMVVGSPVILPFPFLSVLSPAQAYNLETDSLSIEVLDAYRIVVAFTGANGTSSAAYVVPVTFSPGPMASVPSFGAPAQVTGTGGHQVDNVQILLSGPDALVISFTDSGAQFESCTPQRTADDDPRALVFASVANWPTITVVSANFTYLPIFGSSLVKLALIGRQLVSAYVVIRAQVFLGVHVTILDASGLAIVDSCAPVQLVSLVSSANFGLAVSNDSSVILVFERVLAAEYSIVVLAFANATATAMTAGPLIPAASGDFPSFGFALVDRATDLMVWIFGETDALADSKTGRIGPLTLATLGLPDESPSAPVVLLSDSAGNFAAFNYTPSLGVATSALVASRIRWCASGPTNMTVDPTTGALAWTPAVPNEIVAVTLVAWFPLLELHFELRTGAVPERIDAAPIAFDVSTHFMRVKWTPPRTVSLDVFMYTFELAQLASGNVSDALFLDTSPALIARLSIGVGVGVGRGVGVGSGLGVDVRAGAGDMGGPSCELDSECAIELDALTPTTLYAFRVRAVNAQGSGDWSPIGTQSTFVVCADGFVRPLTSLDFGPCGVCPSDTWSSQNAFECVNCPTGSSSPAGANSSALCECLPGFYQRDNATCVMCPLGGFCSGRSARPVPQPGFFDASPSSTEFAFVPCDPASICVGYAVPGCAPGHAQFACSACADGYYAKDNGVCAKCPSKGATGALVALLAVLAVGVVGLFVYFVAIRPTANAGKLARSSRVPHSLAMAVVYLQTLGELQTMDVPWPSTVKRTLALASVASMDISLFASGCSVRSVYTRMALSLLFPVMMVAVALVCMFVLRVCAPTGTLAISSAGQFLERAVLVVGPTAYIPLARLSLVLFDCVRLADGRIVVDSARGTLCYDGAWFGALALALPSLALYVVGIPLMCALALRRARASLFEPATIARYGTLYGLFRSHAYATELALLGKKLAFVLLIVFVNRSAALQVVILIGLFVSSMLTVASWEPYYVRVYNELEIRVGGATTAVLLTGLVFLVPGVHEPVALTLVTMSIIIGTALLLVLAIATDIRDFIFSNSRERERELAVLEVATRDAAYLQDPDVLEAIAVLRAVVASAN